MVLSRYFHTVRHLKPCQVYGRIFRPGSVIRPSEDLCPARREGWGRWVEPARRQASMIGSGRFRFLNDVRELDGKGSWNDRTAPKLWLYNLHYFDDLNADGARGRRQWHLELIRRWTAENPPASGNGWEPYPTSLRIVNWVKWALGGGTLSEEAVRSLAAQARWLDKNLETHLLGNHLFANAKALVFAGLFFEGAEADRWLAKGVSVLRREVPEQILPDGGHFERSPMYHSLILEDLLDLANLARAYGGRAGAPACLPLAEWEATAGRMLAWLAAMRHPDGEIVLFNDAAFGIAPSPAELEGYAARLGFEPPPDPGEGVTDLPESGYIRVGKRESVAFLDVAPLGPDYLPGHGHADTLSFEWSLSADRVLVDTGVSLYESGPERLYQRGTQAHNTVAVDGEDSSEVWGSFRVARRARPFGPSIAESGRIVCVACSHDGYRRLPGKVIHRRTWTVGSNLLRIEDALEGSFRRARSRFLLHPAVAEASRAQDLLRSGMSAGEWTLPSGRRVRWRVEAGEGRFEPAKYHPEFGLAQDTVRLEFDFPHSRNAVELTWD
jgi:uncharacterized heparinase superfamily protein